MNPWIAFAIGVAVGTAGYYAYDKFLSKAKQLGEYALQQAKGNVEAARQHIAKLIA